MAATLGTSLSMSHIGRGGNANNYGPSAQANMALLRGHRGTIVGDAAGFPSRRRRVFRKIPLSAYMIIAIFRMKRLMQPRLNNAERVWFGNMYMEAGVMRSVQQAMTVLANAGISCGIEELSAFMETSAWYKPGTVVTLRQFLYVGKYLKQRFVEDSKIKDHDAAFIALGGNDDLSGHVDAEVLTNIVDSFALDVDIRGFIDELDEDKSGMLEIDEFAELFKKMDTTTGGGGSGALGSGDLRGVGSSQQLLRVVSTLSRTDVDDARKKAARAEAAADDKAAKSVAEKDADQAPRDPQAVLAEVHQWIKESDSKDPLFDTGSKAKRGDRSRRKPRAPASTASESAPSSPNGLAATAGPAGSGDNSNPSQQQHRSSQESQSRKPLWAPTRPADMPAKERLSRLTDSGGPTCTFGHSRRFDVVSSVTAPDATPTNQAKRTHLPPLSARNNAPEYAANPFGDSSPRHAASGTQQQQQQAQTARRAREDRAMAYERQKLPIVARNEKGQSVITQPEMNF